MNIEKLAEIALRLIFYSVIGIFSLGIIGLIYLVVKFLILIF